MKCTRCGTVIKKSRASCPVCYAGIGTEIKNLRIVVEPLQNTYSQRMKIYVTEYDGKEHIVGTIKDFYTSIWTLRNILKKFPNLITVEEQEHAAKV